MKNTIFFLTATAIGFSLSGMERPDICARSIQKQEIIEAIPEIKNILEVPVLMKLALEKRAQQKFSESVCYHNMFNYRVWQDAACCRNLSQEELRIKIEKEFSQMDNGPYAKFVNKADEKLIGQISLGALEWAHAMNRTNKLPVPKWLLEFQPTVEFYPENQWQEKRNEALENMKMAFEDFSV